MQGDWFHSEFWPVYPRKVDKAEALKAAQQKLVGITQTYSHAVWHHRAGGCRAQDFNRNPSR